MIQSLRRGLEILEYMADRNGEATVSDVARFLNVDRSTSSRLMATLEDRGFVHQDSQTQRYRLGTKLLHLGNVLLQSVGFGLAGREVVRNLARDTAETSHLAILVDADVVYIERHAGASALTVNTVVGAREPSYCTATGKALLSGFSDANVRTLFDGRPMTRYTATTVGSVEGLIEDLQQVRHLRYALDREEFNEGVRCVAAPVVDHTGRVVCAVGVSAPAARLSDEETTNLSRHVLAAARRLSESLGYVAI